MINTFIKWLFEESVEEKRYHQAKAWIEHNMPELHKELSNAGNCEVRRKILNKKTGLDIESAESIYHTFPKYVEVFKNKSLGLVTSGY